MEQSALGNKVQEIILPFSFLTWNMYNYTTALPYTLMRKLIFFLCHLKCNSHRPNALLRWKWLALYCFRAI